MSTSIKISIPLAAAAAVLLLAISSHAAEPDPFRPDPSFRPMTNGFVAQWRKANPDDPRNDFALTIDLGQSQPEALAKYPDFKADYDAIMAPPDAIPQVAERDSTFRFRLPTSGFGSLPYMTNRQERLSLARQINAYLNILDEMIPSLNSTDQQWVTNEMRRTKRLMSEKDKSWWDENHAFESSKQYKIWDTRNALSGREQKGTAASSKGDR